MDSQELDAILQHPDFILLAGRQRRLTLSLTLTMLVMYYGFVLLVAFFPNTLGRTFGGSVTSFGMYTGVMIVLLSLALTGIYVQRTNSVIDPLNAKLKQEFGQ